MRKQILYTAVSNNIDKAELQSLTSSPELQNNYQSVNDMLLAALRVLQAIHK